MCLIGGVWNEPDLSSCTLKQDTGSFLLIWFVLNIENIPDEQESKLLEEMVRLFDDRVKIDKPKHFI